MKRLLEKLFRVYEDDKLISMSKADLIEAWNELYEVLADFEDLDDDELIEVRKTIKKRIETAQRLIGSKLSDEDVAMESKQVTVIEKQRGREVQP